MGSRRPENAITDEEFGALFSANIDRATGWRGAL